MNRRLLVCPPAADLSQDGAVVVFRALVPLVEPGYLAACLFSLGRSCFVPRRQQAFVGKFATDRVTAGRRVGREGGVFGVFGRQNFRLLVGGGGTFLSRQADL